MCAFKQNEKGRKFNMNENIKIDVLKMMRKDIKMQFKNIDEQELNQISNNLFILCLAKINNLTDQEIVDKIMENNRIFIKAMEEQGKMISTKNFDVKSDIYKILQEKYIKIIKDMAR